MLLEFRLPDLGEGLTESDVVAWRVAVGDRVELNQVIADIETAKAVVELPCPFAGTVAALHVEAGQTMDVGAPLVSIEVDDDTPAPTAAADDAPEPNLVGYGAKAESSTARRRTRSAAAVPVAAAAPAPIAAAAAVPPAAAAPVPTAAPVALPAASSEATAERPRSTPPVRKLARDLGIDLAGIRGTGENGRITRHDILEPEAAHAVQTAPPPQGAPEQLGDTRIPIKGVRKAMAAAMVASAFTAPNVTEFLTIDVTASIEFLGRLKADRAFESHRITLLTLCSKAVCIALARNRSLNSRWDDAAQEVIEFGAVNLGIAAATQRGLVVPNIKDAGRLTLGGLADALGELTATARTGATPPADLRGGTFTITNIGVFGIDAGTPILNPGEAGILALGAVRSMPWDYNGTIALRQILTLSLSFDHRLVDGAQGSRFLADVGAILHDPARVLALI